MKYLLFFAICSWAFADCLPPPENLAEAPEFSKPCKSTAEKHQYVPELMTPRILEDRRVNEEIEGGAGYEKGEDHFITGQPSYDTRNGEIEEEEPEDQHNFDSSPYHHKAGEIFRR